MTLEMDGGSHVEQVNEIFQATIQPTQHMIQKCYDLQTTQINFIVAQRFIQTSTLKKHSKWRLIKKSIGHGSTQYISGNSSSITIDCNDNFNGVCGYTYQALHVDHLLFLKS